LNPAPTGTVPVTVVPFGARPVRLRIAGRLLVTDTVNLAVAIGFAAMGIAIIALADQPDMTRGTTLTGRRRGATAATHHDPAPPSRQIPPPRTRR